MKIDPLLGKAARLAKKKDYEGALRILKAEEDRYNGSYKYYYLYGVICLHAGNYGEALSNFKMARNRKINDPSIMLGFAVHHLKRMNTSQAVDHYLDVQEQDPNNKIAKNALAIIRKYSSSDALSDWMTQEKLSKLFPPIPSSPLDSRTIISASFILCAALILTFAILVRFGVFSGISKDHKSRHASEFVLSSEDRAQPVETGGIYRYILTRDQAVSLYERALSFFTSYRDEEAKVSINRILESNASQGIKAKAALLKTFMEVPGFDSFNRNDNHSYSAVKNEPALYRDVHVIWRGMATNVQVTDEYTSFDFLIGYDTRITLEGIIPVIFNVPVAINTERPLEVLGRIEVFPSYSEFRLEGVAIHQSGRLEN